jgi:hypothetical protein
MRPFATVDLPLPDVPQISTLEPYASSATSRSSRLVPIGML